MGRILSVLALAGILMVGTFVVWKATAPDPSPSRKELAREVAHLRMRILRLEQKLSTRSGALIGQLTLPERHYDDHPEVEGEG